jgi:hypothetical protein
VHDAQYGLRKVSFVFSGRDTGQMKNALRLTAGGHSYAVSERSVFRSRLRSQRLRGHFRFRAAQAPDGIGANAPENGDVRGLGLFGLAVLSLVFRADELSINQDMVALVERVRDRFAETVERHDAVPLGSGLPLFVRVLPRLLRGDGQHSEIRAVAADLPLLRIFSEEADELDVIEIHELFFSISAPFPWGTRGRSGYCSQGKRLHSGRDPKDSQGGTGKAEDAKQPGAGIIPKPCPRKGVAEML